MFLTKKAIPRRTLLKSAGAAVALPLLDAMIPAATAWAQTPAKPVPRLGFVFIPMGCDGRDGPRQRGKLDELSPILAPLKPVKDQLTVITNTRLLNAYPGTHDTSNSAFLSAAVRKHTESSDYFLGTTIDQIAAQQMGRETQLDSLQLAMDLNPLAASATTVTHASIRIASHGRRRPRRCRPRLIRASSSSVCSVKAAIRPRAARLCSAGQACWIRSRRTSQS